MGLQGNVGRAQHARGRGRTRSSAVKEAGELRGSSPSPREARVGRGLGSGASDEKRPSSPRPCPGTSSPHPSPPSDGGEGARRAGEEGLPVPGRNARTNSGGFSALRGTRKPVGEAPTGAAGAAALPANRYGALAKPSAAEGKPVGEGANRSSRG